MPYIIYADTESLIGCANNPENFSTTKIGEHIPCRYSMSTISAFDKTENKHTLYHGEDCMKKLCESLREHTYIIDFEKKNMSLLTELKSYQNVKKCYICGKRILQKLAKYKK